MLLLDSLAIETVKSVLFWIVLFFVIVTIVFGVCICISFIRRPKSDEELEQDLLDQDKALKDYMDKKEQKKKGKKK